MEIERESTEYVFFGVTGDVPSTSAEVAFLTAGSRPTGPDWESGVIVESGDALWADFVATGLAGDYAVAILVGPFDSGGGTNIDLSSGAPEDYQCWLQLTDTTERPVRIAPLTLEVL